jgi:hypothetical protein
MSYSSRAILKSMHRSDERMLLQRMLISQSNMTGEPCSTRVSRPLSNRMEAFNVQR